MIFNKLAEKEINVLSLFDGMSGTKIALDNLQVPCTYYASEVDPYSESVSRYHYPWITRLGDVTKIKGKDLPEIDLLIGGSPCQGFSVAGNRLNFEDPRSELFFEFVRLIGECKPKYFLLENVRMKKEWVDVISFHLKVEPVLINSALLTAQNRKRFYWANFPISQPKDKGIVLKDIIEEGITDRDKSYCIDASYFKGGSSSYLLKQYLTKQRRQIVYTPVCLTEERTEEAKQLRRESKRERGKDSCPRRAKQLVPRTDDKAGCLTTTLTKENLIVDKPIRVGQINKGAQGQRIYSEHGKSVTINAHGGGQGAKTGLYAIAQRGRYNETGEVKQQYEISSNKKSNAITTVQKDSMLLEEDGEQLLVRKLTPLECERLQGVPDSWTEFGINEKGDKVKISNTRRYQMLGNGFTVPVIEHILKEIL